MMKAPRPSPRLPLLLAFALTPGLPASGVADELTSQDCLDCHCVASSVLNNPPRPGGQMKSCGACHGTAPLKTFLASVHDEAPMALTWITGRITREPLNELQPADPEAVQQSEAREDPEEP